MPLAPGSLLQGGKYRIIRFISSGGFGCTYEAVHTGLNGRMAIKEFFVQDICNRDDATGYVSVGLQSKAQTFDKLREKFIREAQSVFALSHPGIVHVSDVFEENGTAYFVMDYIDGCSLADLVDKNGPMDEATALGYMRQVCAALDYVHANGRLHLDIKPGNIMVDRAGRAVLIDFGASKQYDSGTGENLSTLLGFTPGFAPPEQMTADVSRFLPATDVYALGGTLYNLLTGEAPLSANHRYAGDELKPLPASVSPSTRRAVEAALQLNKSARPQSVAEFSALLFDGAVSRKAQVKPMSAAPAPTPQAAQQPGSSTVRLDGPGRPHPRSKKNLIVAALIAVFVIAVAAVFVSRSSGSTESTEPAESTESSETYGHADYQNLDLATTLDGEPVFFTQSEWDSVPDNVRDRYKKIGVVIDYNGCPAFTLALTDNGRDVTWTEAAAEYGENTLPSEAQCQAMGGQYDSVKKAVNAFSGDNDSTWFLWGKSKDSSDAWQINMYGYVLSVSKTGTAIVRTVAPVPGVNGSSRSDTDAQTGVQNNTEPTPDVKKSDDTNVSAAKQYGHSTYQNLDLATTLDGRPVFFTQSEWNAVPSAERSRYKKVGVVIDYGGCPAFALALRDNGKAITWDEAVSKYGESRLPSEAQCRAMARQYEAVNKAITAFGGDKDPGHMYWGKSLDSGSAWGVGMYYGGVPAELKLHENRVRAVAPVPNSTSTCPRHSVPNSTRRGPDNSSGRGPDVPMNETKGMNKTEAAEDPQPSSAD